MVKSMYAFVREAWKVPEKSGVKALLWNRMQEWRREGSVVRLEHPTRIDRARSLGYKANRALRLHVCRYAAVVAGRQGMSAHAGQHAWERTVDGRKSIQRIAEERASKRFPNMEVRTPTGSGRTAVPIL